MDQDKELQRLRAEWAELEGDAERMAQFATIGGVFHRIYLWFARTARQERHEIERDMGLRK